MSDDGADASRAVAGILIVFLLALGLPATPALGQESPPAPRFVDRIQGGVFIATSAAGGSTRPGTELGLRVGAKAGRWRPEVAVSTMRVDYTYCGHVAFPASCDSLPRIVEVMAGVSRHGGEGADTPSIGFRAGLARSYRAGESSPIRVALGPHASLGISVARYVGLRAEVGARTYVATGQLPSFRAYASLGIEARTGEPGSP